MFFEAVAKWFFDRSTTPLSRILACGIIGSLIAIPAALKMPDAHVAWWQASFAGSMAGVTAGVMLTLFDLGAEPQRPRSRRWLYKTAGWAVGCVLLVALVVVIHVGFDSR